jgi:mannonate dehydratase
MLPGDWSLVPPSSEVVMKLGLLLPPKPNSQWKLAKQIGVNAAIAKLNPDLTGENPPWDLAALRRAKQRFNDAGFALAALEGDQFDMTRIKFGLEGRDEDIANYCQMLENMGRCGIGILCYNFMAGIGWYRTDTAVPARGGALASAFNLDVAKRDPLTEWGEVPFERIWDNWKYFIQKVMPVAERAGVALCAHPDDPPLPSVRGIGRILYSADCFRRIHAFAPSPMNRITFCQSNFMLMGEDVRPLICEFGSRIAFVHFRDVRGTAADFVETFHDDGPHDMPELLRTYAEAGFDGLLRPDHVPSMEGEQVKHEGGNTNLGTSVGYDMLGNIFAVGYIRGMAEAAGIPLT